MNCVCPIAPAQLPVMREGGTSPFCKILSAAISCCSKNRPRRPSNASVEVAEITGTSPRRSP
jgi:hypothetical protein